MNTVVSQVKFNGRSLSVKAVKVINIAEFAAISRQTAYSRSCPEVLLELFSLFLIFWQEHYRLDINKLDAIVRNSDAISI